MEEEIVITKAGVGDEVGIAFVRKETWLATYPNEKLGITKANILEKDFESKEKLEEWAKTIKENGLKDRFVVCAKHNGKIVGFGAGGKEECCNELRALYLLPKWHRKGIGRRLVESVLQWLGKEKKIIVKVAEYNDNAIGFYKKFGFVENRNKSETKIMPSGKVIPEIEMEFENKGIKGSCP